MDTFEKKIQLGDLSLKLKLLSNDVSISSHLKTKGVWEEDETKYFLTEAPRNVVYYDVGSNIGYYSCIFSKIASEVYSFEPSSLSELLQENLSLNKAENVKLIKAGLTSARGLRTLYMSPKNLGDNRFHQSGDESNNSELVEVLTLDQFVATNPAPHVIKVDIQGGEIDFFRGAVETLGSPNLKVVVAEFWPYGLRLAKEDPLTYFDFLFDAGFKMFDLDCNEITIKPTDIIRVMDLCYGPVFSNFVFLK